jgi:hypothetical protein
MLTTTCGLLKGFSYRAQVTSNPGGPEDVTVTVIPSGRIFEQKYVLGFVV